MLVLSLLNLFHDQEEVDCSLSPPDSDDGLEATFDSQEIGGKVKVDKMDSSGKRSRTPSPHVKRPVNLYCGSAKTTELYS